MSLIFILYHILLLTHYVNIHAVASNEIEYRITTDLQDANINHHIQKLPLFQQRSYYAYSMSSIINSINNELVTITSTLKSLGYFDAFVSFHIVNNNQPLIVNIDISPNHLFVIGNVELLTSKETMIPRNPSQDTLTYIAFETAASNTNINVIIQNTSKLCEQFGYINARILDTKFLWNKKTHAIDVQISIDPGQAMLFDGQVVIVGNHKIPTDFMIQLLRNQYNDPLTPAIIHEYRNTLIKTGLFQDVVVKPFYNKGYSINTVTYLPIIVEVTENTHKSITISGSMISVPFDIEGRATFEHINFFHAANVIKLDAIYNRYTKSVAGMLQTAPICRNTNINITLYNTTTSYPAFNDSSTTLHHSTKYKMKFMLLFKNTYQKSSATILWRYTSIQSPLLILHPAFVFPIYNSIEMPIKFNAIYFISNCPSVTLNTTIKIKPCHLIPMMYGHNAYQFIIYENSNILTLAFSRFRFTLKTELGQIYAAYAQSIPFEYLFLLGSANIMKGYPHNAIGPITKINSINNNTIYYEPIGGIKKAAIAFECGLEIMPRVLFTTFIERGRVWDDNTNTGVLYSAGISVQCISHLGIKCDITIAFPLSELHDIQISWIQLYFTVGPDLCSRI